MLPTFVIAGAQKAGTTTLAAGIRTHPDIFMPRPELAHFEDPEYARQSLQWLEAQFADAAPGQRCGFKRPNLLADEAAPGRINSDLPDARIIVVLRDPIVRAVSGYWHTMAGGKIPLAPMEHGLAAILDGTWNEQWPAARNVLAYGCYDRQIERYEQTFGMDRLLVVLQDDLRADPVSVYRTAFAFLDVDPEHQVPGPTRRSMAGRYSMVRQRWGRWTTPLYMRMDHTRTRRYHRAGPLALLARKCCRGVDELFLKRLCGAPRPQLSSALHARLRAYYEADVSALSQRLGRSLDGWLDSP